MATKCPECKQRFNHRTALCIDWRDPERSFGCPYCGTFFIKKMKPSIKEGLRAGLVIGGILMPSGAIMGYLIDRGETGLILQGVLICVSAITCLSIDSLPLKNDLVKSPYSKHVD